MKQIFLSIALLSCIFYGNQATDSCEEELFPKAPCCGIAKRKSTRIAYGTVAEKHEFPWMVYINLGGSDCGGSLINSRWVLSAAHCFQKITSVMVYLGAHSCYNGVCTENANAIKVKQVFAHQRYTDGYGNNGYNDIALLELEESVSFSDTIKPICLPTNFDQRLDEKDVIVAGWGDTEKNYPNTELRKTTIQIWSSKKCDSVALTSPSGGKITLNSTYQICAGGESNMACKGDSGGPLILQLNNENENEPYYQVGIVSFGSDCGIKGQPEINTNVTSYLKWIETTISENQKN